MIRISCSCATCKDNAQKIGATFPLSADIPEALAPVLKAKGARHSFVYNAHCPSVVAAAVRARTGIIAVR